MFSMVFPYQTPCSVLKVWYSMYRPLYIEAYTIPNYTRPIDLYHTTILNLYTLYRLKCLYLQHGIKRI